MGFSVHFPPTIRQLGFNSLRGASHPFPPPVLTVRFTRVFAHRHLRRIRVYVSQHP